MRLKSSVWWAISILLFAASIYFWNLGEQKRAADKAAREHQTNSLSKSISQTPVVTKTKSNAKINRFARPDPRTYRVSNTTRTLAQLQKDPHAILLRNALIDTTKPVSELNIPEKWRAKGKAGSYIVQSDHPLDKAFYESLKAVGAKFVSYIPNNAALVTTDNPDKLPYPAIAYEPYYKADPLIITGRADTNQFFAFTGFDGGSAAVANAISQAGGQVVAQENMYFGPRLIAKVESSKVPTITQSGAVQEVEPVVPRARLNDLTRETLGVSINSSNATANWQGLTGNGVTVNINDTGFDAGHPDLTNRVTGDFATTLIDLDGHGTHVAGIVAGDGTMSTNVTFVPGSTGQAQTPPNYFPFQFRGKANKAHIYGQSIDNLSGPFITDTYLQTNAAAQTNVLLSNNSWGYLGIDPYSMPTASYDAAVRDALPGVKGSQPLLFIFAAGNSGEGDDNGQNAFADTIGSPAAGKNVISVGAVESLRDITNVVTYSADGTTNLTTNAVWAAATDSSDQVASFSSRGNVGIGVEGDFGRFKPDVVAPGVFIMSTRATNWTDPTNFFISDPHPFPGEVVSSGATNNYSIFVPADAIEIDIATIPNAASPNPFPSLKLYADPGDVATTFRGNGSVGFPITVTGTNWTVGVQNTNQNSVAFDLQVIVVRTNAMGDYFIQLKKINDGLAPNYRFESGTSMAAPAVTGVLALMQEYFEKTVGIEPSPALLKAFLINGARSLNNIYDFQVNRLNANDQGWGLVNLPNSIPAGLGAGSGPTVFFDQSVSNSLATGQSITWNVTPTDLESPMRITLVWTDPPGNPAAGVKLVNDLDLIVTNLETGEVFVGNNFDQGNVFTTGIDTNFDVMPDPDTVNNVENVYLFGALGVPLGSNYTVTVRASHVNVNAVTENPDNIAQDFALVISGGDRPTVQTNAIVTTTPKLVTVASNSVALLYQRVGANSPLISTPNTGLTNGTISQWHFFVFTNNVDFTKTNATNVAFVTFLPPNLSQSRLEEPPGVAPRDANVGADIDLYVSTNAALLDLDPVAVAQSDKSTNRGGTEFVVYTNSFSNAVYYIGVKSEDQQASEFGFISIATDKPFGALDANGNLLMNFTGLPVAIPDGFARLPTRPPVISIAVVVPFTNPRATARRVIFSESITHELLGDLVGTLQHNGKTVYVNNHTSGNTLSGATNFVFTFDDLDEGDIYATNKTDPLGKPGTYWGHFENGIDQGPPDWGHTDGPGSLADFVGMPAIGAWIFMMEDNAPNHVGTLNNLQGYIEPSPPTNVLHQVRTIFGNGWFYDFLNIPDDATNLNIAVTYQSGTGPVDIYLRKDFFPNTTNYDAAALNIGAPGGALNLSITNTPPLTGGFWIYGIHNTSAQPVTIAIDVTITRSLTPDLVNTYTNQVATNLLDDAVTTSSIFITNPLPVVSLEVGLRLDHPRLSDLSIELVSPRGTHVMLFEDRGYTNATALGLDTTNDTIYTIFTENTNEASQLIKFALPPYAAIGAVTNNSIIVSNNFDDLPENTYSNGAVFDNLLVTTNEVGVEFEPELNTTYPNYLALGSGGISQTVSTEVGKTYILQHTYHGPNIFDWWTADGNVKDLINPNNDGVFTNLDGTAPLYAGGEVGEAWHFDGTNTEVIINTNACNFGTNDFTVEFWIQTLSTTRMGVMEKRPVCDSTDNMWCIRLGPSPEINLGTGEIGLEVSADNHINYAFVSSTNSHVNDGQWHHVAFRRDEAELSIFVDGQLNADVIAPDIAYISNSVPFVMGQTICQCCGLSPFAGNLDEVTVYQRSLSPAEIYDIYAAGHDGKRTTTSVLPNINYIINGATNDTLVSGPGNSLFATGPGDAWQTNTIGFTATNSSTEITIKGNPLGMLLDDVVIQELPHTNFNNYFLPEESLSAFAGEIAAGLWTLEIHDARAGQAGKLLDWELNITYSSTNVHLITLQPGQQICTNVPANGYTYFAVDVPKQAKFATNTLNNTGASALNLIFNQTTLPTGFSPGDAYLLAGVAGGNTAAAVLSKNSGPPFLTPGQRYFLAVQNQSAASSTFCMQVDFDINTNFDITSLDDPNPNPLTTNVLAGSTQYYYYDISNSSVTATFSILNPTADVDMVISHSLPLPDGLSYDYGSFNAGTNDEFIVVKTNSSPVALTEGRWYITVYNTLTNPPNVTYTIQATQSDTNAAVNIFPLDDGVALQGMIASPGFSLDGNGVPTYYSFTITNSAPAVEFVISNLTGNLDLVARFGNLPTPSQFDFGSFNSGNTDERLVITTNSSLPSLNGTWYLGIPDNGTGPQENFDIAATTLTNATSLPFPSIATATASYTRGSGGGFTFTFNSLAGQTYYIDMSTNLVDWSVVAKITARSSSTTFTDVNPPDRSRYYRLRTIR